MLQQPFLRQAMMEGWKIPLRHLTMLCLGLWLHGERAGGRALFSCGVSRAVDDTDCMN